MQDDRQESNISYISSASAVFFRIRKLTCNAAGSPRLSVVRNFLYFLTSPVQSSFWCHLTTSFWVFLETVWSSIYLQVHQASPSHWIHVRHDQQKPFSVSSYCYITTILSLLFVGVLLRSKSCLFISFSSFCDSTTARRSWCDVTSHHAESSFHKHILRSYICKS